MIENEKWICIELFHNTRDELKKASLEHENFRIIECKDSNNRISNFVFFEGLVSAASLINIVQKKRKKRSNEKGEEIVMSGPCGRGRAIINVHFTETKNSIYDNKSDSTSSKNSAIFHLISITLHWKQIIDCLFQCFNA